MAGTRFEGNGDLILEHLSAKFDALERKVEEQFLSISLEIENLV